MRSLLVPLATFALVVSGCHCGQKLDSLAPQLVIVRPTAAADGQLVLDFGAVQSGQTSTQPIVILNRGQLTGTLRTVVLRAGSDPAFSLPDTHPPVSVEAGGQQHLDVAFAPTASASATGYVDITTDDPKLPQASIKLTAVGQSSQVEVCVESPADGGWQCNAGGNALAIDFGPLLVNGPPALRRVEVRDLGSLALGYQGTTFAPGSSSELSLVPDQSQGSSIAAGSEVDFQISFAPTAPGAIQGTAIVTTADGATPAVPIQIAGKGVVSLDCHLDVSPMSVDFGSVPMGTTQDQSVLVVNDGAQPCTVSGLTPGGSAAFSLVSPPMTPDVLGPNGVLTLDVHYVPMGADTGSLTIASNDPMNPSIVVPLTGTQIAAPPCVLTAAPASVTFGGTVPGDHALASVGLTSTGTDLCTVTTAVIRNHDPAYTASGTFPMIITPAIGGPFGNPFGTPSIGVSYAPTAPGVDADTLDITYIAGFGGPTLRLSVPLMGTAGARQLCIVPKYLHFGAVPAGQGADLSFAMTACGTSAVTVSAMTAQPPGGPFSLSPPPALPLAIALASSASQTVHLQSNGTASNGQVLVHSNDPAFADQVVYLDTGPELVPPDAGELLYSWTAGAFSSGGAMSGSIYKTSLQGPANRTAFYGTDNGQACAGCHAVSPDGKYVALVEYSTSPTMRIVDARTGGSIPVPGTANGIFPSWRPNVNTTPPYQFVYNDGNVLKTASVVGGIIGTVSGADLSQYIQSQPSWGPNGTIAFVRGTPSADAGVFEIVGPADLMTIPEGGGAASAVVGASGNGGDNYYPEYSPNGKFIAFTFSAAGMTTRSASDSVIKLVNTTNGSVISLPQLNAAGPNSWPTWAKDGTFLSFSSSRSGGMGSADVYFAPVDQNSGLDGPAQNLTLVNTINFDHIARWAYLPP